MVKTYVVPGGLEGGGGGGAVGGAYLNKPPPPPSVAQGEENVYIMLCRMLPDATPPFCRMLPATCPLPRQITPRTHNVFAGY